MLQNWLLLDLRAKIDFLVLFGLLGFTENKTVWCHFYHVYMTAILDFKMADIQILKFDKNDIKIVFCVFTPAYVRARNHIKSLNIKCVDQIQYGGHN
jgi:hypothetical protein